MMRKRNNSESKVSRSQGIPNNYIINKKYYNYNNNKYKYNAKEENFINNTINNSTLNTTSETQIYNLNNSNNLNPYCTPKIEKNRVRCFSPNSFTIYLTFSTRVCVFPEPGPACTLKNLYSLSLTINC